MKTKILTIIAFLAVVVFTKATAQQTTTLVDNISANVSISFSPNGKKVIVAKDYYENNGIDKLGLVKTFTINTSYNPILLGENVLQKGNSSVATVIISPISTTISDDGTGFVYFRNDVDSNNDYQYSLVRNGVVVGSYTNKEIRYIKSNNANLYLMLVFVGNGTQAEFTKINASNSVEWTVNQSGDLGKKILLNEGNPFVQMQSGNLIEYNSSNGSIVSTTTTDDPYDTFQLITGDYVEKFDKSDNKLYTLTGITEWEHRFWENNVGGGIWKKIGNYTYVVSGTTLFVFDENMEDVYDKRIDSYNPLNYGEYILSSYIYDDASVGYITKFDSTVYYKHFDFPTVDVPIINSSASNVVAAHNEQIFDGTNWIDSNSFISTVVMNDADLPSVGDNVDPNLVTPPSGYTLLTANGFAPSLNSEGYAEYIFHIGTSNVYYIRLKLYFIGTSALDIEANTVSSKIIASPNPCNNSIKISNIREMDEISVFDNIGQLVFRKELIGNPNNYLIDFSNFKSGVYVLQLKNEKGIYYKKIIKK